MNEPVVLRAADVIAASRHLAAHVAGMPCGGNVPHVQDEPSVPDCHALSGRGPHDVADWERRAERYHERADALAEQLVDLEPTSPVALLVAKMATRAARLAGHYRAHVDAHQPKAKA